MSVRILALVGLVGAGGCAAPAADDVVGEDRAAKIVGDNDLVVVASDGANVPERYRSTLDAFGLMRLDDEGRNHCTVTHVGGGLVLTAGHCFDAPKTRKDDVACPAIAEIAWGYRDGRAPYLVSTCERILAEEYNGGRDWAIFRVTPAPTVALRVDLEARPAFGTNVTVFSHPRHRPLEWSQTCGTSAPPSGSADQFLHACDTEPASSGATVLDDATLAVVAIHNGAWAGQNYATYLTSTPLADFLPSR